MGGSPGDVSEEPVTYERRKKGWRISCDEGEVTESLENEQSRAHSPTLPSLYPRHNSFSNPSVASPTSQLILILQAFRSLHLRHSSFSSPSLALPTSQLILQPFRCFTYVTAHSPTLLSPLVRHLASRPCLFTWNIL